MAEAAVVKKLLPKAEGELKDFGALEKIDRPTEELVIGLVGAVGAGVSRTAELLRSLLQDEYGYTVTILKASELIRTNADKTACQNPATSGSQRIQDLQKVGTELRNKYGEDYVAAKAIEKIAINRKLDGGYDEGSQVPQPKKMRQATIIDSLKHPKEAMLFRRVYGGMYWQFTIFAPEEVREKRLKLIDVDKDDLPGIFTRDDNDKEGDHGQKVSKTAYLSDFFIRNDAENDKRLRSAVERYLQIIFNISVHTPTGDEAGMYAAVSAASKSACLSRQVGAAIYSASGELISVGWNDVPKALGGLYSTDDGEEDHRCYLWGGKLCHNDRKKEQLYGRIFRKLRDEGLLAAKVDEHSLRAQPKTKLSDFSKL